MTDRELRLKERELDLAERRLAAEIRFRIWRLRQEQRTRRAARRGGWRRQLTPSGVTLLVAVVGGGAALLQAQFQGRQQLQVEQAKARNNLILQAMKTGDVEQARQNLLFLAQSRLLDLDAGPLEQALKTHPPALPGALGSLARFSPPDEIAAVDPASVETVSLPESQTTIPEAKWASRGTSRVEAIVLHNAVGPESTVQFLRTGPTQASYHWIVTPSGDAVPLVRESDTAFHLGRGVGELTNKNTIGIAVAGEQPLGHKAQTAVLYALLAKVLARWDLPTSALRSHDELDPRRNEGLAGHMEAIRNKVDQLRGTS